MSGNFVKEDLRIIKSCKALLAALPNLLERRNFRQLTVNEICSESQLSRTAFYSRFRDKYALLQCWLKNVSDDLIRDGYSYKHLENRVNEFVRHNTKLIRNVLEDADSETLDLVYEFVIAIVGIPMEKCANDKPSQRYVVMSTFCAGGVVNYINWQVKNGFPFDSPMMNSDFYNILNFLSSKMGTSN